MVPARQPLQVRDLVNDGDGLMVHDPNTGNDWVRIDADQVDLVLTFVEGTIVPLFQLIGIDIAQSAE